LLVAAALGAGHTVTAFARDPGTLAPAARLDVVRGDVFDPDAVDRVVAGKDAVLSALGGKPFRALAICATATRHMIAAMERHGVRRLVCMSTFGAGDTRPQVGWFTRHALLGVVLAGEVADKEAMERLLEASALDWVVVRVNRLTDEPARGRWRSADDGSIRGMRTIPRADVAAFMVAQLESAAWVRRKPVIAAS
jgi:putative NADH-flavin reductase